MGGGVVVGRTGWWVWWYWWELGPQVGHQQGGGKPGDKTGGKVRGVYLLRAKPRVRARGRQG